MRYSESSSHSGTASSSKTAESPDWKSRLPRLPCKTRPPSQGRSLCQRESNGRGQPRPNSQDSASPSLASSSRRDRAYIPRWTLFFPHQVSSFTLRPDTHREKEKLSQLMYTFEEKTFFFVEGKVLTFFFLFVCFVSKLW